MPVSPSLSRTRSIFWRTGGWIIGIFWLVQFIELTLVGFVEGGEIATRLIAPRAANMVAGVLLTAPIIEAAARSGRLAFKYRLALTVVAALAMCSLMMGINYFIFYVGPLAGRVPFNAVEYIYVAFGWSWFFLGVAGAVVGLTYSVEMLERERRLAAMEAVAKDARLAALRYQLNPHFLFNTLNSIAALVAEGENQPAETMVESLADFLRASLELDPIQDISLAREIELQALYLSIEQVRFPSRLRTTYSVAEEAKHVLVPALITQPIVENAIRHAVARSTTPITIAITAVVVDQRLRLIVENDGPAPAPARAGGLGVGMANVAARLENKYGDAQALKIEAGPTGYRVTIELPRGNAA